MPNFLFVYLSRFDPIMQNLNSGVIVPIITPFNMREICAVIDHIRCGGIGTIALLGTTGEALQIRHQNKLDLIRMVADYLQDDMKLVVGISSPKMDQTIELMEAANQAGAVASLISPLIVGNDVLKVMESLLQESTGKFILYNYPGLTNEKFIPIADIQNLLTEPRIIGIKDSSGDLDYFAQLLACKNSHSHFKVYYGPEKNLSQALHLNIDGFVPGTGNLAPQLAARLWKEKENGPWEEWHQIKEKINNTDQNYISALKQCMKEIEIITDSRLF